MRTTSPAVRTLVPALLLATGLAMAGCGAGGSAPSKSEAATPATMSAPTPAAGSCPDDAPSVDPENSGAPATEVTPTQLLLCTYDTDGHLVATYTDAGPNETDTADGVISYAQGTVERVAGGTKPGQVCPAVMGPTWLIKVTGPQAGSRQWVATASGCSLVMEVGSDYRTPVKGAKKLTMSDALLYDLTQQLPGAHDHDHGGEDDHTH
jgi:hypothetical protein